MKTPCSVDITHMNNRSTRMISVLPGVDYSVDKITPLRLAPHPLTPLPLRCNGKGNEMRREKKQKTGKIRITAAEGKE